MSYRCFPFSALLKVALLLVLFVAVAGCVTQTNNPFERKANREAAEANYVALGLGYIRQGNLGRARDRLQRALEIDPESAEATAAMGLLLQMQGDTMMAREKFQQALEYDPDYTRGRTFYGAFLYSQEEFEASYQQFLRASKDLDYPSRDQVFVNLALSAIQTGRGQEALQAFQRALDLNPANLDALRGMIDQLLAMERYDQARKYYQRLESITRRVEDVQPTPGSLWAGIRIARHFGESEWEKELALLLRNLYPKSEEYKQYKALTSDE